MTILFVLCSVAAAAVAALSLLGSSDGPRRDAPASAASSKHSTPIAPAVKYEAATEPTGARPEELPARAVTETAAAGLPATASDPAAAIDAAPAA